MCNRKSSLSKHNSRTYLTNCFYLIFLLIKHTLYQTTEIIMNDKIKISIEISPKILPRHCGGWLAVSPERCPIRIGVTAETEAEVREKFAKSMTQWIQNLNSD